MKMSVEAPLRKETKLLEENLPKLFKRKATATKLLQEDRLRSFLLGLFVHHSNNHSIQVMFPLKLTISQLSTNKMNLGYLYLA